MNIFDVHEYNRLLVKKEDLGFDHVKQYQMKVPDEALKVVTRESAYMLQDALTEYGYVVKAYQGARNEEHRDKMINKFKDGLILILGYVLAEGFDKEIIPPQNKSRWLHMYRQIKNINPTTFKAQQKYKVKRTKDKRQTTKEKGKRTKDKVQRTKDRYRSRCTKYKVKVPDEALKVVVIYDKILELGNKKDVAGPNCFTCGKLGHLARNCTNHVSKYDYYKNKMNLAKMQDDGHALLTEDEAWLPSVLMR
ncbi:LOW QUALITY PROTEIN: hypothetical protein OSB04_031326 [Centaurea solstitialis]|uniref:CCHC-type domain-containing protein n=1 Tax=Centaurea solstitialis TaxID=347529 RepID=A0AA38SGU0_9ASTR|nr:LOW QUALITY PROTEIN: hypothetical protein OSB04_031326 [Centaurea solstitialis]